MYVGLLLISPPKMKQFSRWRFQLFIMTPLTLWLTFVYFLIKSTFSTTLAYEYVNFVHIAVHLICRYTLLWNLNLFSSRIRGETLAMNVILKCTSFSVFLYPVYLRCQNQGMSYCKIRVSLSTTKFV